MDYRFEVTNIGSGPVAASGQVTNPGQEPADIVVTVDWITPESDVLSRAYSLLCQVPPGASLGMFPSRWTIQVNCVLTVRAGKAAV